LREHEHPPRLITKSSNFFHRAAALSTIEPPTWCADWRRGCGQRSRRFYAEAYLVFGACCAITLEGPPYGCEEAPESDESWEETAGTMSSAAVTRSFVQTGFGNFKLGAKLASYNVRRDNLLEQEQASTVFQKLRANGPDVLCLQEVEAASFRSSLAPSLFTCGYSCTHIEMEVKGLPSAHGVAMCWKTDEFEFVSKDPLCRFDVFDTYLQNTCKLDGSVYVVTLRHRASSQFAVMLSGVVSGDTTVQNLKVAQSLLQMRVLRNFTRSPGKATIPYVMCSDVNQMPSGSRAWQFDGDEGSMRQLVGAADATAPRAQKGSLSLGVEFNTHLKMPPMCDAVGDSNVIMAFVECMLYTPLRNAHEKIAHENSV
jgi:exonuclease III